MTKPQMIIMWSAGVFTSLFFYVNALSFGLDSVFDGDVFRVHYPVRGVLVPFLILAACTFLHVTFYKKGK